ncbi:hypothetical protein TB2_024777 [Malus domestica]
MVTTKLARGRNFPMGSQHQQRQSLNLAPKDSDEGDLIFSQRNTGLSLPLSFHRSTWPPRLRPSLQVPPGSSSPQPHVTPGTSSSVSCLAAANDFNNRRQTTSRS